MYGNDEGEEREWDEEDEKDLSQLSEEELEERFKEKERVEEELFLLGFEVQNNNT